MPCMDPLATPRRNRGLTNNRHDGRFKTSYYIEPYFINLRRLTD